jgi:hypothetical protein
MRYYRIFIFKQIYLLFTIVRIHLAQIIFRTLTPFSNTTTRCRFGLNLRFVARIEKLRLCPNVVVFPQFSHFAIS